MAVQVERAAEAYQRGRHEECLGLLQQGVNTKILTFAQAATALLGINITVDLSPSLQLDPDWRGSAGSNGS